MVYVFDSKFDRYKANKIYKLIKAGAIAKQSASRIIDQLRIKDVTYRRKEMLHDIRRARGVEFSKTRDTYITAGLFYDYVYEPFRSEYNLKSSQANKILRDREHEIWETPEELEQIENIDDKYLKIQELL